MCHFLCACYLLTTGDGSFHQHHSTQMLAPFCNSFTIKKINFTAAGQPAALGIGLSQLYTDKGAQTASFNFILFFQSTSTLRCEHSPAAPPVCIDPQRGPQPHLLWHQDFSRAPRAGDLHIIVVYRDTHPKSPGGGWRKLLETSKPGQHNQGSVFPLYLIPAMHFLSTLQSPRMFCGLRKQVTSKVWLIQNCHRSISLMQEWKKSVFGDIQQNEWLKALRKEIKCICYKGE